MSLILTKGSSKGQEQIHTSFSNIRVETCGIECISVDLKQDANMRKAWKFACARPKDFDADTAKICQLHFDQSDYEKVCSHASHHGTSGAKLKSYAMPTLNLPRISIEQTSEDADLEELSTDVILVGEIVPNKKCGVINCKSQTKIMFDFPNYQNNNKMYLEWISFCDNDKLKNMQPEELDKSYGICDVHFKDGIMALAGVIPMIQTPSNQLQTTDEIYVASRLCRLCFDVGGVDMFSCRYHSRLLKDIVKMFIPIQIKADDVSKLICEACKSAIMKFYDFQERSLEVNKFFESINNEVTNNTYEITSQKTDYVPVVEITDDEEPEDIEAKEATGETVVRSKVKVQQPSLLRQRLTMGLDNILNNTSGVQGIKRKPNMPWESISENLKKKNRQYAPSYVLTFFHNYGKEPSACPPIKKQKQSKKEIRLKNKKRKIVCIHCDKTIESLNAVEDHCKAENHAPVMICRICKQTFKSAEDLSCHSKTHVKDRTCVCEKCGKQFARIEILRIHLKYVHNKGNCMYECKSCPEKFSTKYRLNSHIGRIHTKEKPYCCEKCGAVFACRSNLKCHQMIHSDHKPHICLICNKGFRRRAKLSAHLITHTGERRFPCDKCGVAFKGKYNLQKHNRRYHSDSNEEATATSKKCMKCDFTYNSPIQLRVHKRQEHKTIKRKIFECKYCQKRFSNSTLLGVHMVVHTGAKKFECEICNRKFSQKPHLQSHLLVHTGEKPYKCKYCPKRFAHLSTQIVHQRIHTGETPYVCQFCGKGYGHLTNYKKHVFSQHGVITPKQRNYSTIKVENEEGEEGGESKDANLTETSYNNITTETEDDLHEIKVEDSVLFIQHVILEEES